MDSLLAGAACGRISFGSRFGGLGWMNSLLVGAGLWADLFRLAGTRSVGERARKLERVGRVSDDSAEFLGGDTLEVNGLR
jgi:hypothetical protein